MKRFKASYVYGTSILASAGALMFNSIHWIASMIWFTLLIISFLVAYDKEKKEQ